MEFREYARVVLGRWWLILAITLVAVTVTMIFSYNQTPIYQASSTYVTRLNTNSISSDSYIFGIDTLMGRQRIFVTYCDVMASQTVLLRAFELMNIEPGLYDPDLYSIECVVLPESNVLQLTVDGPVQALIRNLNESIGLAAIERINALYAPFPIETLDPVALDDAPVSPNYNFNLILSAVFGVVISVTLALLLEQLRDPLSDIEGLSIRDVRFNVYNARYFHDRLGQEIERSRIRARPLSLAVMDIRPTEDFALLPQTAQEALLRTAANIVHDNLRQGDLIAHLRGTRFQVVLPETPGDEAVEIAQNLSQLVRQNYVEAGLYRTNFSLSTGIVESSGGMLTISEMLGQAEKALERADGTGTSRIELIRTTPRPFVLGESAEPQREAEDLRAFSDTRNSFSADEEAVPSQRVYEGETAYANAVERAQAGTQTMLDADEDYDPRLRRDSLFVSDRSYNMPSEHNDDEPVEYRTNLSELFGKPAAGEDEGNASMEEDDTAVGPADDLASGDDEEDTAVQRVNGLPPADDDDEKLKD